MKSILGYIAAALLSTASASAATVLYDNLPPIDPASDVRLLGGAVGDVEQANFFTIAGNAAAIVAEVAIRLNEYPGNEQTASLYTNAGGQPSAVAIGSVTLNGDAVDNAIRILTFTFDPLVTLTSGSVYWLVLSGDTDTGFEWVDSSAAPTSEPYRQGGGAWTAHLSAPGAFRISGELAPVPLPAAGWLLLAAIGSLTTVARRRQRAELHSRECDVQ